MNVFSSLHFLLKYSILSDYDKFELHSVKFSSYHSHSTLENRIHPLPLYIHYTELPYLEDPLFLVPQEHNHISWQSFGQDRMVHTRTALKTDRLLDRFPKTNQIGRASCRERV